MKRRMCWVVIVSWFSSFALAGGNSCTIALINVLVQDILDRVNIIAPQVSSIYSIVSDMTDDESNLSEQISSEIDELSTQLSLVEEVLGSKIDILSISQGDSMLSSKIDDLSEQLSQVEDTICSKIDELSEQVSIGDSICECESSIDALSDQVSQGIDLIAFKLDVNSSQISQAEVLETSLIGDLESEGSCLESLLDVPDDINNLQLNVVALLKTILLELRGCNVA